MTGIVNKVKEALHSGSSSHSQPEGTHGHHTSKTANAADPRIDSDRDHRAAPATGAHDGSYTTSDNYTYGSGNNRGTDGPATRTDGPHGSNVLNKADPRVDSDRDHSRNMGANPSGTATTGAHNTTGTSGLHSTTGTTGTHTGTTGLSSHGTTGTTGIGSSNYGAPEGTHGPHGSKIANRVDPRVDSDADGSRNMGMNTSGTHTGTTGTSGLHSSTGTTGTHTGTTGTSGLHSSTGTTGTHTGTTGIGSSNYGAPEGTHGPHGSKIANRVDPRVDSDADGSRNMGMNTSGTHTGTTGTSGIHSTTGTHTGTTGTAGGKPAVGGFGTGSTTHGTNHGTTHGTTTGVTGTHAPGPAPNTAGPHKSDMLNKVDPRVDSDMDGSKTNPMMNKDPTDAAQVPPSVLQKHIGPPVVEHDDHSHGRSQRHSISHQEEHRGL